MNRFSRLDLTAGTTLFILSLLIAGLILYFNSVGIFVRLEMRNPPQAFSPLERLTLRFSEAVLPDSVENQLQIEPPISGAWTWLDARTAQFTPAQPWQGTATLRLMPGPIGKNGAWLRRTVHWTLTVRAPQIVYLSYSQPARELMSIPLAGGAPRQLTNTSGRVFEFSIAPSGDQIVYSALNEQQGMDVWRIGREGQNPQLLLACGASRCAAPAWSPREDKIAYSLSEPFGTGGQFGATRPRILELESGEDRPLFETPEQIGYGGVWSPNGQWLSAYDGIDSLIRVVNLETGEQVIFSSNYGMTGAWSPDSRYFFYGNVIRNAQNQSRTVLYRADFETGDIETWLGSESDSLDAAFSLPAWSPNGEQTIIGLRVEAGSPARHLWLVSPLSLGGPMVADEPGFTYDFYQWDPWGTALVFQQANLNDTYRPEVVVWTPIQGMRILHENGTFPRWLP